MGVLSSFVSSDKKKSNSKTPIVDIGCESDINNWIKAHDDKKDAEARIAECEALIIPKAEAARLSESMKCGKLVSSVKLNGKITFVTQQKYSDINTSNIDQLKNIFGEQYDQMFKSKVHVEFTDKATNDETLIEKLINLVGYDKFSEYFKVTENIVPTTSFHELKSTDKMLNNKASIATNAGLIKQYKPSIKIG
jgi:hypothetical protein